MILDVGEGQREPRRPHLIEGATQGGHLVATADDEDWRIEMSGRPYSPDQTPLGDRVAVEVRRAQGRALVELVDRNGVRVEVARLPPRGACKLQVHVLDLHWC